MDTLPGLRERKKARTREQLREHAQRLFREQGFDATTVAEIAAAADVSEPTFFRYFPSKVAVALAPLEEVVTGLVAAVLARPDDEPPVDACLGVADALTTMDFEIPPTTLQDLRDLRNSSSPVAGVLAVFDEATEQLSVDFARRLGTTSDDPVAAQTATVVMGTLLAVMRSWLDDPDGIDPIDAAAQGLRRLRGGLR
ncbi:TetR/AcrR family transcriptional regulator [Actinospongicola halichondriae]|uniref:TetR/AcrR family transcriptional regulator n=1 Tax=Actinospongicola halichondriae TaxID=3236844 RepID=UPI003D44D5E8